MDVDGFKMLKSGKFSVRYFSNAKITV